MSQALRVSTVYFIIMLGVAEATSGPGLTSDIERASEELAAWCCAREFAGHDPFDALNSRLFRATPLYRSRLLRLVWTQLFKRSPVNLRILARVPLDKNAKGTALFALAALAAFRRAPTKEKELEARALLDELLAARLNGWRGAARAEEHTS